MMCAIHAGRRGRKTLLLDHSKKIGGKILISGGGRCNFTNTGASPNQYVSENPHFAKSALARFTPSDFIEMVKKYGIEFHEKKLGQQFCDGSAQNIVDLLRDGCTEVNARIQTECAIKNIEALPESELPFRFEIKTTQGVFRCESLVIATGGLSIPKIGATGFGYEVAKQFGLKLVKRAAALDGFTLNERDARLLEGLSGLAFDAIISCNGISFEEAVLITHAGLSGPATLQASLHWHPGDLVKIDMLPHFDLYEWLIRQKKSGSKTLVKNLISERLPGRLAERFCEAALKDSRPIIDVADKDLKVLSESIKNWTFTPKSTVGYNKAEVTRGGVDTNEISSKTMESKKVPGLYFIGEVVDVTGWLGGYNFQWAWASGAAAGEVV
jgi:predicted Rossmann fold flavoprotein